MLLSLVFYFDCINYSFLSFKWLRFWAILEDILHRKNPLKSNIRLFFVKKRVYF